MDCTCQGQGTVAVESIRRVASGGIVVIIIEFRTTHGNSLNFVGAFSCSISLATGWDTAVMIILDRKIVVVVVGIIINVFLDR